MPLFKRKKKTARIRQVSFKPPSLLKFLPLFLIPLILYTFSSVFRLKNITCSTFQGECPEPVLSILNDYKNHSILSFNRKQLISSISEKYTLTSYDIDLSLPGSLNLKLDIQTSLPVEVYLVTQEPFLSFKATDSASFFSPLLELDNFIASQSSQSYLLESTGHLSSSKNQTSDIKIIFNQKPTSEQLANFYTLYNQMRLNLPLEKNYLFNTSYFLNAEGTPDIIVSISASLEDSLYALQSIPSLSTIKPGARLIDLRFEHPVIR